MYYVWYLVATLVYAIDTRSYIFTLQDDIAPFKTWSMTGQNTHFHTSRSIVETEDIVEASSIN